MRVGGQELVRVQGSVLVLAGELGSARAQVAVVLAVQAPVLGMLVSLPQVPLPTVSQALVVVRVVGSRPVFRLPEVPECPVFRHYSSVLRV